jgi:hypothetical protein
VGMVADTVALVAHWWDKVVADNRRHSGRSDQSDTGHPSDIAVTASHL